MIGDPAQELRIVGASSGPRMNKKQQRFHKLVKDVARLKEAMRAWSQALPELHRGIAEHERLRAEHRAVVVELVRLFDRSYSHRTLTKRERARLREILCETAYEVMQEEGHEAGHEAGNEALKEIYNRHSRGDFDTEAAAEDEAKTHLMRIVLEEQFGFDFGRADIRSIEELEAATSAQMDELDREAARHAKEEAARRARRKKSAREVAAEARREAERAQVGKALQEVYRKLAIALHPDREPDPEERARKTLLMQQINVAYEAKDLLQLLELQLRFEQLDEAQISTLAEDRLERYNRLLAEQVAQLKQELAGLEAPWRMQLEQPTGRLTPARVRACLQDDLRMAASLITYARNDLQRFADPGALKAWLAAELAAERRRMRDPF
jgi:hypothetical protein